MNGWESDKKWSDKYLPEIKQILGLYLISEPPIEEDQERNTDLTVLKMDTIRIGCRIRKHYYFEHYPHDFTIRSDRPSGNITELAKIIQGWGQYLFYGFSDEQEKALCAWHIIDLNIFRLWWSTEIINRKGVKPGVEKPNSDGSSCFRAFDIRVMPDHSVFAHGGGINA